MIPVIRKPERTKKRFTPAHPHWTIEWRIAIRDQFMAVVQHDGENGNAADPVEFGNCAR